MIVNKIYYYSALILFFGALSSTQAEPPSLPNTQLVMLGTGTPFPNPERSGPSVAIVVNDTPYIVDFGPGMIRQAAAMTPQYGGSIKGLEAKRIKRAFLTHMHTDHSAGYADLIFTGWTMDRDEPLEVYGPEGIGEMTEHIIKAYDQDKKYRLYSEEPANNSGWRVNTHKVAEGPIYKDANISVEAFPVKHGTWPNSFGYRFTTDDKVIVVSGDLRPSESIEKYSENVDILVHEVYSTEGFNKQDPTWQNYMKSHHTSTEELGALAQRAKVKMLVLYHVVFLGSSEQQILKEIRNNYDGKLVLAKDREVF